jgi:NADH:ubiquinone oxidoreductase subunit F (NADH-binding)
MLELGTNVTRFFRNESCGKCVPCRVGTEKAVHILEDALAGRRGPETLRSLEELEETLRLTSICGLGQAALGPVLSVFRHFPSTAEKRAAQE